MPRRARSGDVDNDGDQDLFVGGGIDTVSPAPNQLLLNDGTGTFTAASGFPAGSGRVQDAVFVDVDADEDLGDAIDLRVCDSTESPAAGPNCE